MELLGNKYMYSMLLNKKIVFTWNTKKYCYNGIKLENLNDTMTSRINDKEDVLLKVLIYKLVEMNIIGFWRLVIVTILTGVSLLMVD